MRKKYLVEDVWRAVLVSYFPSVGVCARNNNDGEKPGTCPVLKKKKAHTAHNLFQSPTHLEESQTDYQYVRVPELVLLVRTMLDIRGWLESQEREVGSRKTFYKKGTELVRKGPTPI